MLSPSELLEAMVATNLVMPIPDIRNKDQPVGPLRAKFVHTLGDADYVLANGFICQVVGTGDVSRTVVLKTKVTRRKPSLPPARLSA